MKMHVPVQPAVLSVAVGRALLARPVFLLVTASARRCNRWVAFAQRTSIVHLDAALVETAVILIECSPAALTAISEGFVQFVMKGTHSVGTLKTARGNVSRRSALRQLHSAVELAGH